MSNTKQDRHEQDWDIIISPTKGLFSIQWADLWRYRDLLLMFVKRDLITVYKQTILGPVWFAIQPIMTTLIFIFIFGRIAGISTDGVPKLLFYLSGVIIWSYFQECFSLTSKTFRENANIFGKVYFPRMIAPVSKVISSLIKFSIQFMIFLIAFTYYKLNGSQGISPNITLLLFPVYLIIMALMALGLGLIFSSLTSKYRDLNFLIQFGVQLLMYASPVIYPLSAVPAQHRTIILLNPLTSILEGFKYSFLGHGYFSVGALLYSAVVTVVLLIVGILIFNRTEKDFIDTV